MTDLRFQTGERHQATPASSRRNRMKEDERKKKKTRREKEKKRRKKLNVKMNECETMAEGT